MKNNLKNTLVQVFSTLVPYLVRTVTSFIKYGVVAGSILTIYSIRGYLRISNCCWIIILTGIIVELSKMIAMDIINKYKEDIND